MRLVGGRARLDLYESYGAAAPDDQVKFAPRRLPTAVENAVALEPQHCCGARLSGVAPAFCLLALS
jgi:hypothetical protein